MFSSAGDLLDGDLLDGDLFDGDPHFAESDGLALPLIVRALV